MDIYRRTNALAYRTALAFVKTFLKPLFMVWLVVWLAIGGVTGPSQVHAQDPEGGKIYLPLVFGADPIIGDPDIQVSPASLEATLDWGATGTRTLTISNRGPGVLRFELVEIADQVTPLSLAASSTSPTPQAYPISVAIYDHYDTDDISYFAGGNANTWALYQAVLEADPEARFEVTIITDLSPTTLAGFSRLILPDNAVPDSYLDAVADWFTPGKRIIAVDSAICYAAYSGLMWPASAGSNGYWTYWDYGSGWNDQEVLSIDNITEDYTPGQVLSSEPGDAQMFSASLPPDASQLTAKQWDHAMVYVSSRRVPGKGTMVVLGPYATGVGNDLADLIWDAVEGDDGTDLAWLSEDRMMGSVSPHGVLPISVAFDTSGVDQPGIYQARLRVASNDPDAPFVDVPVTMTAPPHTDMGKLAGGVSSDRPGGALEGALVEITSGATSVISDTTDASGGYGPWWLMGGTYAVSVTADGYQAHVGSVSVSAAVTATHDVMLTLDAPQIEVSEEAYVETLGWGETVVHTLTITNSGPAALEFELVELGGRFAPMQVGAAPARAASIAPEEKVGAQVWAELEAASNGQTEFFVFFREQADLRPAYAIEDWDLRGEFVLKTLRDTAESSQSPARAQVQNFVQRGEATKTRTHYIVNAMLVNGSAEVVKAMAARPEVAAVRAVRQFPVPQPIPGSEQPTLLDGVEWNIHQISADRAWQAFGVRGEGVVVANIDSGVRYTHQALVDQYRGNLGHGDFDHNFNWWDPSAGYSQPVDDVGHGTHTMGTMVGGGSQQIGVSPGAHWIAARGCGSFYCSEASLISAAEWVLAPWDLSGDRSTADPSKRPHVVNNSWGGPGGDPWLMAYVDAWRAAGIFPAFSDGNWGPACGTSNSPGDYPAAFATGATNAYDLIADFSSRGPSNFGVVKPDVSAPGVNVRSAWSFSDGAYYVASGTSMASPHVAGLVALLWSANPALIGELDETASIIQSSALAIPDAQCGDVGPPNNVYGWGRIDAFQAISQTSPDLPWLTAEPATGVVPAHGAMSVTVTFDASQVKQPGTYQATLRVKNNDPFNPHLGIPVTMMVSPHPHMGRLVGSVTSDRPGGALEGARVEVVVSPTEIISGTTDPTGGYGPWWLMNGAYDVTVSADGYLADARNVAISPGVTTTHNVTLRLDAPQVQVTPPAFEVTLPEGRTSRQTLTVENVGVAALTFEITETIRALGSSPLLGRLELSGPANVVQESKEENLDSEPPGASGLAAGGPDPFGYTYRDSNEADGPRYEWIEIAPPAGGAGTEIPLRGVDDGYYWPLHLPFSFNFYGTDYNTLAVASNGTLYFEDDYLGYSNFPIPGPNWGGVERFIAHFWDDLVVSPGAIYYRAEADRVIIEYYQVSGFGGYGWGTWQVILFADGNILFQYQDVIFDGYRDYGRSATVGVQGDMGTGLGYSYNSGVLSDAMAICFGFPGQPADCSTYRDVPWLAENPTAGTVLPGAAQSIGITFDAAGLATGSYTATLVVLTNDPDRPWLDVPVTMNVVACDTTLFIDPPQGYGVLGAGSFTMQAVIRDVTDLGGFEFDLGYDPAIVHVENVSVAPFPGSTGRAIYPVGPAIDNEVGAISFGTFSAGEAAGPSGRGPITDIILSPRSVGASLLDVWDAQVTDTRGEPATLCIESGAVTVSECHFADFDCDCDVDLEDVMAVADRWGCEVGMSCYDPTYDLDADGDIDIADVMRVVPYWGWSCASSASFRPLAGASLTTEATLILDPAERTMEAGQTLTVQVVLDGAGNAAGFEFELGYDPSVVRVGHVALGDFLGTTGRDVHALGPVIDAGAGRLRLGGYSLGNEPGATGRGILAQINFVAERDGEPGLALYEAQVRTVSGGPQPVALP